MFIDPMALKYSNKQLKISREDLPWKNKDPLGIKKLCEDNPDKKYKAKTDKYQ